jgi:hypothetical protein
MRPKTCLAVVLALLLGFALAPRQASATCTLYGNSQAVDHPFPYGPACQGTGPGCNECLDLNPSTGGLRICYWTTFDFYDMICFTYGNPPENQQI